LAASGTVATVARGDLAVTEGTDTAAFTGAVIITGVFAATEAADTFDAASSVRITGDMAASESADILLFSGGPVVGVGRTASLCGTWRSASTSSGGWKDTENVGGAYRVHNLKGRAA